LEEEMREDPESPDQRYQRIKAILFEALEVPAAERGTWLTRRCGSDEALRAEVDELLAGYQDTGGFLGRRPEIELRPRTSEPQRVPEAIGAYRVLGRLGWGAMGVVYLAEQETPRRRVALKVLRADCHEPTVRGRFEREARSLARLSHPGIAHIYESGVVPTEVGEQAFLALELVPGGTLREHCREQGLDDRARIELVIALCEAVQHAHDHGVLHRDLKPDNVLIDAGGRPKIVDFGVARLADEVRESLCTRTGQLIGTVAYMSPEQLRGAQVDERTDQYALAVMLYELLTGHLPTESRAGTLVEAVRRVDHEDPTPPSTHDPRLRGDLETVLLKALESEPARRYARVEDLAQDLRSVLEGRPVIARPPTRLYQLRKLVGRHRLLAGSVGATILALAVGLGMALEGNREARAAERRLASERRSVLSLSNLRRVEELRAEAGRLIPFGPEQVEPLRDWLARAEALRANLGRHREDLALLREHQNQESLGDPDESAFLLEALEQLVTEIEDLVGPDGDGSLVRDIRRRLALGEELERRTLIEPAEAWRRALRSIADPTSRYGGLCIERQLGLVPLGPDGESRLEEFLVYGTGTIPERGQDGQLEIVDSTGVILVLLPGGPFLMGSQSTDLDGPNFSPSTQSHEGPPRRVVLDPFLIGKHEVTQAQWDAFVSEDPSYWRPGESHNGQPVTLRFPVESISRSEARDFALRIGCELPTEARWEYVARADQPLPISSYDYAWRERVNAPEVRTGFPAEVGSYVPSAFGLFDTMGNVSEWCLDVFKVKYFELPLRPGDGLVLAEPDGDWSIRGGAFSRWEGSLRLAGRFDMRENTRSVGIGLRVVRSLSGSWFRADPVGFLGTCGSHLEPDPR
jgi:formylglycine-generating enzyme required for sulfatase activity